MTSIKTWWTMSDDELLSSVYHSKGQLPPQDPTKRDAALVSIKKQLETKFPPPLQEAVVREFNRTRLEDLAGQGSGTDSVLANAILHLEQLINNG